MASLKSRILARGLVPCQEFLLVIKKGFALLASCNDGDWRVRDHRSQGLWLAGV